MGLSLIEQLCDLTNSKIIKAVLEGLGARRSALLFEGNVT